MKKKSHIRFNPLPCNKCGGNERYIASGKCVTCQKQSNWGTYSRQPQVRILKISDKEPLLMRNVRYQDAEGYLA